MMSWLNKSSKVEGDKEASCGKEIKKAVSQVSKQPFFMVNGKILSQPVHTPDQFFILPYASGS
ncbi:hypothetical protein SAMN02745131_03647 [Flavisolibacter ginsengisoli DSM 18119]|uniref:Uncharacterized protein n=1 Tax=Flavisolibacter ginsengisoli DSM 18119 TaxID=1121884 RepID=A0A1M5EW24_9BACT|nr:hypothetical protein SAMN02745131_03647 [Flavisolibacter ginsengisoli DSM 18119]